MLRHLLAPALLLEALCGQTAQTLALPDLLDLRPVADRLTARIGELQAESTLQTALGNPGVAAQINAVVANLLAWQTGATSIPTGSSIEFHMVGFYEGDGATSTTPGTAAVEVDRPGTAVALILNAYDPISWTITQTPGTAVIAVVAYSYEPQALNLAALPGVPSVALSLVGNNDGDYFGMPNDPSDTNARFRANSFAVERLGSFLLTYTGDYSAPAGTFTVGAPNPDWRDQWVLDQAIAEGAVRNTATRANLLTAYQGATFLPLYLGSSQLGPAPSTIALASPLGTLAPLLTLNGTSHYAIGAGFTIYTLSNGAPSTLDLSTLTTTPLPVNPALPTLSFANAFTYDQLRDRVLVSSFSGQGELRAFDVATSTWSVLTQWNNDEPRALSYHPNYDQLHGLRIDPFVGPPEFVVYDAATGAQLNAFPLPLPVFDEFLETHQLYPLGAAAVYVGPSRTLFNLPLRQCFVIDPTNGNIAYAGFLIG